MSEVAGDAELRVDLTDIESIANGLIVISSDDVLRSLLVMKGAQVAKLFPWGATTLRVKAALGL
jgi:hypothetical protein